MELRKEQSDSLARNSIEEKCDQCANKTVSGRGLSVASIWIRIDPCAPTARACFKVAHIHRGMLTLVSLLTVASP